MPTTTLSVTTSLDPSQSIRIFIDHKDVKLDASNAGTASVTVGDKSLLVWMIAGDPGSKYKITLAATDTTLKLKAVTGTNPVDTNIPASMFRDAGYMRFVVS